MNIRKPIAWEEYDFGKLNHHDRMPVWNYEIFRQVLMEDMPKSACFFPPFLSLSGWQIGDVLHETPAVWELMGEKELGEWDSEDEERFYGFASDKLLHHFVIDWSKDRKDIIAGFSEWVEKAAADFSRSLEPEAKGKRGGRKHDAAGWLEDLAIYRLKKAGAKRSDIQQMLGWVTRTKLETSISLCQAAQRTRRRMWCHAIPPHIIRRLTVFAKHAARPGASRKERETAMRILKPIATAVGFAKNH